MRQSQRSMSEDRRGVSNTGVRCRTGSRPEAQTRCKKAWGTAHVLDHLCASCMSFFGPLVESFQDWEASLASRSSPCRMENETLANRSEIGGSLGAGWLLSAGWDLLILRSATLPLKRPLVDLSVRSLSATKRQLHRDRPLRSSWSPETPNLSYPLMHRESDRLFQWFPPSSRAGSISGAVPIRSVGRIPLRPVAS